MPKASIIAEMTFQHIGQIKWEFKKKVLMKLFIILH